MKFSSCLCNLQKTEAKNLVKRTIVKCIIDDAFLFLLRTDKNYEHTFNCYAGGLDKAYISVIDNYNILYVLMSTRILFTLISISLYF